MFILVDSDPVMHNRIKPSTLLMMLKNVLRNLCQKLLGFDRYLFLFSLLTIFRIRFLGHEKEFRFFTGMIHDNGAILDIGANIGVMTTILAKKYPSSIIYSFEPLPANCTALKKVIDFYQLSNVKIFETALGNSDGEIKMIMPVINDARMQGLSHVLEPGTTDENGGDIFMVPLQKLDHIIDLQQIKKISAIKIDVENFEWNVLKGAELLLKKHRPVIFCELWNNEQRNLCFEFMKELGYTVKVLQHGKLIDFSAEPILNFFFLP